MGAIVTNEKLLMVSQPIGSIGWLYIYHPMKTTKINHPCRYIYNIPYIWANYSNQFQLVGHPLHDGLGSGNPSKIPKRFGCRNYRPIFLVVCTLLGFFQVIVLRIPMVNHQKSSMWDTIVYFFQASNMQIQDKDWKLWNREMTKRDDFRSGRKARSS